MKPQSAEWEKRCKASQTDRQLRIVFNVKHITEPSGWVAPPTSTPFSEATVNGTPLFTLLKWQPQNIKRQLKRRQPHLRRRHLIVIKVIGGAGGARGRCRERGHFEMAIWPSCQAEILKGKISTQVLIEAKPAPLGSNQIMWKAC